ncbi:hypothetical protein BKA83DRAFT_4126529 [Pisolithus microcarpus]|nr:hypothetical protein BKA83DRAFT_4126529 [Pisolithus microcarpus]
MSNMRYNLRRATRARANSLPHSPLAQPGADANGTSPLPKLTPLGSQYSTPAEKVVAENVRTYSDVVRTNSRSLSPAPRSAAVNIPDSRMTSSEIPDDKYPEAVAAHTVRLAVPDHSDSEDLPLVGNDNAVSPTSMSEAEKECDDERSWTKVVRKKSRERRTTGKLRPDQERVIREAERQLTPDERDRIRRRSLSSARSEHGRPKDTKGKGPDPKDWGVLDMSEGELDLEAQRAALASWNAAQRIALEIKVSEKDSYAREKRLLTVN